MEDFCNLKAQLSSEVFDATISLSLLEFFTQRAPVTQAYRFRTPDPNTKNRQFLVTFDNQRDALNVAQELQLKTFAYDSVLIELDAI